MEGVGGRRRGVVAETEERDVQSSREGVGGRRRGVAAETEERDVQSSREGVGGRRQGVVAETEERDARSSREGVGGRRRGVAAETEESGKETGAAIASLGPRLASSVGHGSLDEAVQPGKRRNSRERKMPVVYKHVLVF